VEVTPDGNGDAIVGGRFVMPESQTMTFGEFLLAQQQRADAVFYISHQDSSMTSEFTAIEGDIETEMPWATEVFGQRADAVNLWCGPASATTSLHKDHYENLYCVVKGTKTFLLYQPSDIAFLSQNLYPSAQYRESADGTFAIVDLPADETGHRRPWIDSNPRRPDFANDPLFKHATAVEVTVGAGEMLFLPSLWFHTVAQTGTPETSGNAVAINYWYDMKFDARYATFKFMEALGDRIHAAARAAGAGAGAAPGQEQEQEQEPGAGSDGQELPMRPD